MKEEERLPKLEAKTSAEEAPQIKPRLLKFLLFYFKVKSDSGFSPQRLWQEIIDFDTFVTDHKGGPLDLRDKVQELIDHKAWTGDAAENFRIGNAIYRGWLLLIFGTKSLRDLITERGKQRTASWLLTRRYYKNERIQETTSDATPLSPEQLKEMSDAFHAWDSDIAPRYEKIITDMFQKGIDDTMAAENQLWRDAKSYMERFYKHFGIRLCARVDCLKPIPQGSRSSRKYCSGRCKDIEKSRKARRR